jgi:hypothetical protein
MNTNNNSEKKKTYQRADGRRNKAIVSRERRRYVSRVSLDNSFGCYYRVEQELDIPRATVRYWYLKKKNAQDQHEVPCGSKRTGIFFAWEKPVVQSYLIEYLTAFPCSTLNQLATELSSCFSRKVTRKV